MKTKDLANVTQFMFSIMYCVCLWSVASQFIFPSSPLVRIKYNCQIYSNDIDECLFFSKIIENVNNRFTSFFVQILFLLPIHPFLRSHDLFPGPLPSQTHHLALLMKSRSLEACGADHLKLWRQWFGGLSLLLSVGPHLALVYYL